MHAFDSSSIIVGLEISVGKEEITNKHGKVWSSRYYTFRYANGYSLPLISFNKILCQWYVAKVMPCDFSGDLMFVNPNY